MFHSTLSIIQAILKPAGIVYNNDVYTQHYLPACCQFHNERRKHVFRGGGVYGGGGGMMRSTDKYCEVFKNFLFSLKMKNMSSFS